MGIVAATGPASAEPLGLRRRSVARRAAWAGRSRHRARCAGRVVTMAKGRGRSHGESAGRRGAARRGAGSSTGRSSSGSQSRPHRHTGGAGESGAGTARSPQGKKPGPQAKGRGGRTSGANRAGHPLHSGQTGRTSGGGKSAQASKRKGRPGQGQQRSESSQAAEASSAARSRQAAPGTARSARTSSTQAGRSGHRRSGWGKGIQWAHIGGGRLTGAPDSVQQGPEQPRSGRLRKPIPPQPRYGLRRALVLGGILLFLLLLLVAVVVGYLWVRGTIRSQDEQRAAAQVHTVYPTPGTCDASTLSNTVQGPESVGVGTGATFSISLVNKGSAPCLLDAGSQAVGVRVSSGSQQVWDSVTCPVGQTKRPLLLPPGQAADVSVTWNGNAATSDCAAATALPASSTPSKDASGKATDQSTASADPSATGASSASASAGQAQTAPGSAAGAGTYRFRFVMGDKDLTEDRVFVVG